MRLRRPLLLATVALLVVASACAGDDDAARSATSTTTSTTAPTGTVGAGPGGFRPAPIAWDSCGRAECATVKVPLDYSDPTGRKISLSVLRIPAPGKRIGALFVNPGGPGGSATEFASQASQYLPHSVTDRFDIVGVEPRGLEGSAPLHCGVDYTEIYGIDPTVEDAADRTALIHTAEEVAAACKQHAGDLLAHVGTRDVARDLDAVRASMGEAKLSYYGASYGTAIGQEYAELFPDHVRSMVLDGVVELGPSGLQLAADQAAGFETALSRFADHCRTSGVCKTKDPVAAVTKVEQLAEKPGGIPAPSADRPAGPGEVTLGIDDALYAEFLWPQLDRALSDGLAGDGSGLVSLADDYLSVGDFDLYFAVNCLDFAWPTGDPDAFLKAAKDANARAPHFGEGLVTDYIRCADWPVPPDPLTAVTATGAPPIVVISTTGDPATPYDAGVRVAKHLASGVLVTNEGDGHGAVGLSSCIDNIFVRYLVDGMVPADGTTCHSGG